MILKKKKKKSLCYLFIFLFHKQEKKIIKTCNVVSQEDERKKNIITNIV